MQPRPALRFAPFEKSFQPLIILYNRSARDEVFCGTVRHNPATKDCINSKNKFYEKAINILTGNVHCNTGFPKQYFTFLRLS